MDYVHSIKSFERILIFCRKEVFHIWVPENLEKGLCTKALLIKKYLHNIKPHLTDIFEN